MGRIGSGAKRFAALTKHGYLIVVGHNIVLSRPRAVKTIHGDMFEK
jgi:hypothetical protein